MRIALQGTIACLVLALCGQARAQDLETRLLAFESAGKPLSATLRMPAAARPLPAVIVVHGTAGIDARGAFYREALHAAGFATFEVDFRTGIYTGPFDRPRNVTFVPHLYAAVAALQAQPEVDRARIGMIGFSLGGQLALNASVRSQAAPYEAKGLKLAALVASYPSCQFFAGRGVVLNGRPTLVFVGTKDGYTTPDDCRDMEREANSRAPGSMEVVVYEGTYHGFEAPGSPRTISDPAARDGKVVIGHDPVAAADARRRAADFFKRTLGK